MSARTGQRCLLIVCSCLRNWNLSSHWNELWEAEVDGRAKFLLSLVMLGMWYETAFNCRWSVMEGVHSVLAGNATIQYMRSRIDGNTPTSCSLWDKHGVTRPLSLPVHFLSKQPQHLPTPQLPSNIKLSILKVNYPYFCYLFERREVQNSLYTSFHWEELSPPQWVSNLIILPHPILWHIPRAIFIRL